MREFVCRECGNTVVVNPGLPADYTPNTCSPCYDKGRNDLDLNLVLKTAVFLKMIGAEPKSQRQG